MEKLIELLNEYEKELNTGLHWRIDEKYWMLWRWINLMWVDQYLISKHYWFIKWLVENDNIDISKTPWHFIYHYTDEDIVKEALMHLAIQDKPIEFLISILKNV
jgi:hypothetical protein